MGRVFCAQCGARLDFSQVKSSPLTQGRARHLMSCLVKLAVALIVLGTLLAVLLAVWPRRGAVGDVGTIEEIPAVTAQLRALSLLADGQAIGLDLKERALNAYLMHGKARRLKLDSLSVELAPGRAKLRLVRPVSTIGLGFTRLHLGSSYELEWSEEDGQVTPVGASLGHLPVGRAGWAFVAREIARAVAEEKEFQLIRNAAAIEFGDDKLTLRFEK